MRGGLPLLGLRSFATMVPMTEENTVSTEFVEATEDDAYRAFEVARTGQKAWAHTPIAKRKEIFLRYHDLILAHRDELLDLIQKETGKSRASAFDEVMDVAITCRHYSYRAEKLLKPKKVRGALPVVTHTVVQRAPKGVVGIIAPWNYPLVMAVSDAIPALLAGNSVVLKPDLKTPLTALRAHELLLEAGLPASVFQIVPGPGSTVGQVIVGECDYLMFTGSTATGRTLAAQAGERLIGFSAELGGKNPLIVLPSADVEKAARGAINACFSNTGQLCISIERIYVHSDIASQFISRFRELTENLSLGYDWGDDVGSLISTDHLKHVHAFVEDAKAKGATVLTGGHAVPDVGEKFYAPTILTDVSEDADLYRSEVFGPVVYIEVVGSVEEAIAKANDTDYGLNSSIWGAENEAREVASQIESGTVNINEGFAAAWASLDAPMGGWKSSGVGRRHADEGLTKYTESRSVAVQRFVPIAGPAGVDKQKVADVLSTALKLGKNLLR
ncbi:succinic semialdehyde dehydrogenase [Corynebacterium sp. ZY180755]